MTASSDISRIERSILIRAPRERVWKALTDIAEFSNWFGVKTTGAFVPGGAIDMTSTKPGYEGIQVHAVIERMDAPHTFSWRWHPGIPEADVDYSKESTTLVEFSLKEVAGGTEVTVVESGFDGISLARRARVFETNRKGWEHQMASLASYLHAPAQH